MDDQHRVVGLDHLALAVVGALAFHLEGVQRERLAGDVEAVVLDLVVAGGDGLVEGVDLAAVLRAEGGVVEVDRGDAFGDLRRRVESLEFLDVHHLPDRRLEAAHVAVHLHEREVGVQRQLSFALVFPQGADHRQGALAGIQIGVVPAGRGPVPQVDAPTVVGVAGLVHLLSDVWQEGSEQFEEGAVCRRQCVRRRGVIVVPEPLFGDLQVVVTERVPERRPEFVTGLREGVVVKQRGEPLGEVVDVGEHPPVDGCQFLRFRGVGGRQPVDELRGVPDLPDEFSPWVISFVLNGKSSPSEDDAAQYRIASTG